MAAAQADVASAPFKQVDAMRKCSVTGVWLKGKSVTQPLRFFISEFLLHTWARVLSHHQGHRAYFFVQRLEAKEGGLRLVECLRVPVEARLEALKQDKAAFCGLTHVHVLRA